MCSNRFLILRLIDTRRLFGFETVRPLDTFQSGSSNSKLLKPGCNASQQWEERTLDFLSTTDDIDMIRDICCLPFHDYTAVIETLSRRWDVSLDFYLVVLCEKRNGVGSHDEDEICLWTQSRKAMELLKQVRHPSMRKSFWDWECQLLNYITETHVQTPNRIYDNPAMACFREIFREWAALAFGHEEHAVTSLWNGLVHTRLLHSQQLDVDVQLLAKYELVQKVGLPQSSPTSNSHNQQALRNSDQEQVSYLLVASSLGLTHRQPLDFIRPFLNSIRAIFACDDASLLVRRYTFLETKFALMGEDNHWAYLRRLSLDVFFLDHIISVDPKELARLITRAECKYFLSLTLSDLTTNRQETLRLNTLRSSCLVNDIIATLTADGRLLERITDVVKVG